MFCSYFLTYFVSLNTMLWALILMTTKTVSYDSDLFWSHVYSSSNTGRFLIVLLLILIIFQAKLIIVFCFELKLNRFCSFITFCFQILGIFKISNLKNQRNQLKTRKNLFPSTVFYVLSTFKTTNIFPNSWGGLEKERLDKGENR